MTPLPKPLFAIGIPTINRADLLIPALNYYDRHYPNIPILVIDNGHQKELDVYERASYASDKPTHIYIFRPAKNLGVAGSWNALCRFAFNECAIENILLLNDDIEFGKSETSINDFITANHRQEHYDTIFTGTGSWCAFLISKWLYKFIGPFDEKFYPAYYEDQDYSYRLRLAGRPHRFTPFMNPDVLRESQSRVKNPNLNWRIDELTEYYRQKWGGHVGVETFKTPFNK